MNLSLPQIATAVGLPLLFALGFRRLAHHRPSWGLTAAWLGLGAVTLVPQVMLASRLGAWIEQIADPYLAALAEAFLGAALPEELARLAVVALALALTAASPPAGRRDGYVLGAIVGCGFAALEGVIGVLGGETWLQTAGGRTLGCLLHATGGGILGFFLAAGRTSHHGRRTGAVVGLSLAVALHTLYDLPMLVEVTEPALSPDDALPAWPHLALLGLWLSVLLAEAIIAIALLRASRRPAS